MIDEQSIDLTPASIDDVLTQFAADCPALKGAFVATPDGLLLGSTPSFQGDTLAAVALNMLGGLERDLSLLAPTNVHESLLWTDAGVWYISHLPGGQVLLAHTQGSMSGTLRLAGKVAAVRLASLMEEVV